jgi:ankyrin repeat protein
MLHKQEFIQNIIDGKYLPVSKSIENISNLSTCLDYSIEAVKHGRVGILKLLIDKNAKIDDSMEEFDSGNFTYKNNLLYLAISKYRNIEIVKTVLVDAGFSPLIYWNHNSDVWEDDGIINWNLNSDFYAMTYSVFSNDLEMIKILSDYGYPIIEIENDVNQCVAALPIHAVIMTENIKLVEYFIEKGSDINIEAHGVGVTPIMRCVQYGYSNMLEEIINYGAKLNKIYNADYYKCSELGFAIRREDQHVDEQLDALKILVAYGSDTSNVESDLNAFEYAKSKNKNQYICNFLETIQNWSPLQISIALGNERAIHYNLHNYSFEPFSNYKLLNESLYKNVYYKDSNQPSDKIKKLCKSILTPWNRKLHSLFHKNFRKSIYMIHLIAFRYDIQYCKFKLPIEIWQMICSFLKRSDFEIKI